MRKHAIGVLMFSLATGLLLAPAQAAGPYTIAVLPDTQHYCEAYPATFHAQTQWIVDQRVEENIVFVTHEGDITDNWVVEAEWEVADAAMGRLDTVPDLPYAAVRGNHDDRLSYTTYFGASRYAERSWFGGASGDELSQWQTFEGSDGRTFLHLGLEFTIPSDTVAWAQGVIDAHPGMPTIITTHWYIDTDGNYLQRGQRIYDELVHNNSQVFMVLSGHVPGAARHQRTNAEGQVVYELVCDYQNFPNGGDGWMRQMTFKPYTNEIEVATYSPTLDQYMTDGANQFTLSMDFSARLGEIPDPSTLIDLEYEAIDRGDPRLQYDVDNDGGTADQQDMDALIRGVLDTEYGDVQLDGDVDIDDFAVITGPSWQQLSGMGWADGDMDGDGDVDVDDASMVTSHWQWVRGGGGLSGEIAGVPEPNTAVLGIVALLGLAFYGWCRKR